MPRLALAVIALALPATVVLDNPRVKVFRTTDGSLSGVDHGPGVVIALNAGSNRAAGAAVWMDDVAAARAASGDRLVIVQPRRAAAPSIPLAERRGPRGSTAAPAPGGQPFTGMSFNTVFENDRVRVVRARMDVGAREAFHTHGSDTIVVHLSGGEIEDTANGKTVVNRWKPGDVEFEAVGSSHSARNLGKAVDAILVALQP